MTLVRIYSRASRPSRTPAGARPRASLGSRTADSSSNSGRRDARLAPVFHRATRTWTLDALRAATEPVKEEAMQAIVEFWMWLVKGCVCRSGAEEAHVSREKSRKLAKKTPGQPQNAS